mmetsp:Transcript_40926/g.96041  ORF Transcript_40926/g.96041 Transcript_40926/m.96041 type:complete len:548 (-) Transcript_40926:190-1833(-)
MSSGTNTAATRRRRAVASAASSARLNSGLMPDISSKDHVGKYVPHPSDEQYDEFCDRQGSAGSLSSEFGPLIKFAGLIACFVVAIVLYEAMVVILFQEHGQHKTVVTTSLEEAKATALDLKPIIKGSTSKTKSPIMHLVFSTDCSSYQHWQSYLLFYSALRVHQDQVGYVTRIASGCTDSEIAEFKSWHEKHISSVMSSNFEIHFTPHFSSVNQNGDRDGKQYLFFNKPFGLKHWMEHGKGMGTDPKTGKMTDEGRVVALLDPDMILLRRITHDFSDSATTMMSGGSANPNTRRFKVEHGYPFGQKYGFGSQWMNLNGEKVTNDPNSPSLKVSRQEASEYYPVGPPYIATSRDMYKIATKWADFVPRVHDQLPSLMAEMFAYSWASAHLGLPHQVFHHGMISSIGAQGEGWDFVNNLEDTEICGPNLLDKNKNSPLPLTMHYCQRYFVGDYFFGKRKLPTDIFSCASEMMEVPPLDLPHMLVEKRPPGKDHQTLALSSKAAKGNAFMICGIAKMINEAADFYKKHDPLCNSTDMNMKQTMNLWKLFG